MDAALIPATLLAHADRGEEWAVWLDELPRIAADLLAEWDLTLDGSSIHGQCALVLPVRTTSARPAVLKIGFRDDESEHEHLALQRWHGVGAVELLRADPHRGAQLLERLHHEDLRDADEIEACEIYRHLHVPALPQLRTLTSYVDRWSAALAALPRDAAPMLWNRWDEVVASTSVRDAVRRRFHTLVDVAGLDEHRARDWVVVRMVLNAHWCLEDAARPGHGLTDEDTAWITECIAIAKAVQD